MRKSCQRPIDSAKKSRFWMQQQQFRNDLDFVIGNLELGVDFAVIKSLSREAAAAFAIIFQCH